MVDMNLQKTLEHFGLNEKEALVFITLSKLGSITVLELSRHLPVKRTSLYRILEELKIKGIVETQIDAKTTYYTASGLKQFETFLIEQESKTKLLKQALQELTVSLPLITTNNQKETKVRFFRGTLGLKQMEWRMIEGSKNQELLLIGTNQWFNTLGIEFAENIRQAIVDNKALLYELQNPKDIEVVPANGKTVWTNNQEYILRHFHHRQLSNKVLQISQDVYIFADTIQFHGYHEEDMMGIEIQSNDFAQMFRQIFWHYWNLAKVIDNFGKKMRTSTK